MADVVSLPDLNVLRLHDSPKGLLLEFGDTDVSYAARGATTRNAMNQLAEADVELDYSLVAGQPVDYFAGMRIGVRESDAEHILFTGSVTEAIPAEGRAQLHAMTFPQLTEQQTGVFATFGAVAPELLYTFTRLGGVPEARLHVQGLDEALPLETVEIVTPVKGVSVDRPFRVGDVRFVPATQIQTLITSFSHVPAAAEFTEAPACAVVLRVAKLLLDAELAGLRDVDAALAWLTVRSRYGLAVMPDGSPQRFERGVAIARPSRGRMVIVRGLNSQRCWLRETTGPETRNLIGLSDMDRSWTLPGADQLGTADRQATLACARAATAIDPLQRILALWEAIEFYVQGRKRPRAFAKSDIKRIRRSLPGDLPEPLAVRLDQLLGQINEPSLRMKLRAAIAADGVPITESEVALLNELRDSRNDAVHGRATVVPDPERIDHAVSVVARMLLHRLHSRRRAQHY